VFVSIAEQNIAPGLLASPRGNAILTGSGISVPNAGTPSFMLPEVMDGTGKLMIATATNNVNLGFFTDMFVESGAIQAHLTEGNGNGLAQTFDFICQCQPIGVTVHNLEWETSGRTALRLTQTGSNVTTRCCHSVSAARTLTLWPR
jgi:hypothetical protein